MTFFPPETGPEVLFAVRDHVATISLNRPEDGNGLTSTMLARLAEIAGEIGRSEEIRVVVLGGSAPGTFCTGSARAGDRAAMTPEQRWERTEQILRAVAALAAVPVPLIAMIDGPAIFAGLDLALVSDIRYASDWATFGVPEVKTGVFASAVAARLPRLVGPGNAKLLMYSGAIIGAAEALRLGLVERVFAPEELERETLRLAAELAANAPLALRALKTVVDETDTLPLLRALVRSDELRHQLDYTEDYTEGLRALAEGRRPEFRGR